MIFIRGKNKDLGLLTEPAISFVGGRAAGELAECSSGTFLGRVGQARGHGADGYQQRDEDGGLQDHGRLGCGVEFDVAVRWIWIGVSKGIGACGGIRDKQEN